MDLDEETEAVLRRAQIVLETLEGLLQRTLEWIPAQRERFTDSLALSVEEDVSLGWEEIQWNLTTWRNILWTKLIQVEQWAFDTKEEVEWKLEKLRQAEQEPLVLAKTVEPVATSQNTGIKVLALGSILALFATSAALAKRGDRKDTDFFALQ